MGKVVKLGESREAQSAPAAQKTELNRPLIIGGGVAALAVLCVGLWFAFGRGGGETTADTTTTPPPMSPRSTSAGSSVPPQTTGAPAVPPTNEAMPMPQTSSGATNLPGAPNRTIPAAAGEMPTPVSATQPPDTSGSPVRPGMDTPPVVTSAPPSVENGSRNAGQARSMDGQKVQRGPATDP